MFRGWIEGDEMTKDELIEQVTQIMVGEFFGQRGVVMYEDHIERAARAVVDLMMPPPLVWEDYRDKNWRWFILEHDDEFYVSLAGETLFKGLKTLEAAQAAAQAHADAAWIANTRAAQEAKK